MSVDTQPRCGSLATAERSPRVRTDLDADGKFGDHASGVRAHHGGSQNLAPRVLLNGDLGETLGDALALAAVDLCHLALTVTFRWSDGYICLDGATVTFV